MDAKDYTLNLNGIIIDVSKLVYSGYRENPIAKELNDYIVELDNGVSFVFNTDCALDINMKIMEVVCRIAKDKLDDKLGEEMKVEEIYSISKYTF